MAQIYLLVAGVMLCCIPTCSPGSVLPWYHSLENRELFKLLQQLKSIPSQSCLNDRTDFKFPWKRGTITQIRMTQGTCFHHQILQQIFNLFSTKESHAIWNNALLHKILFCLDHSLEQMEHREEENLACPHLGIVVRKYFQRINLHLKEKEYSPCVWEVVRREIKMCLSLI
ncbi:interferon alpha-1/13-like [Manis pentadactyla]|uniref:interferon alpha-1/13-like n=1 Tax=Manis pentadactyla TaxID=143292 RepID=UPI00255CB7D4|nr:interferon alpha-1/13-like [Manis pentadactyla]